MESLLYMYIHKMQCSEKHILKETKVKFVKTARPSQVWGVMHSDLWSDVRSTYTTHTTGPWECYREPSVTDSPKNWYQSVTRATPRIIPVSRANIVPRADGRPEVCAVTLLYDKMWRKWFEKFRQFVIWNNIWDILYNLPVHFYLILSLIV